MNVIQTTFLAGIFFVMLLSLLVFGKWYQSDTGQSLLPINEVRASLNLKEIQRLERKDCLRNNPQEPKCCSKKVTQKMKDLVLECY